MNMRTAAILLAIGLACLVTLVKRPAAKPEAAAVGAVSAQDARQPADRAPEGRPVSSAESGRGAAADAADIPARPEQIVFKPLEFEPPDPAAFRRVLADGTVVYLAPSHEFPLVKLTATFKGGGLLDPADVPGLASMTAKLVREGGTVATQPAALDELLDFLATEVSVGAAETFTTASMNCLKANLDESLRLFVEMLRSPAFDAQRLVTAQARVIEALKQRNDDASSILSREWKRLLYGVDHFEAAEPTDRTMAAVSRERMVAMHRAIFHPGNMIVSVTGDFDEAEMLEKLSRAFAGWERGGPVSDPAVPTAVLEPGLYHVPKNIPQGKVVMGLRSIERDDADAIPFLLLNEILGAGGFTSRLMQQVRSNEGLAYSVRSSLSPRVNYPGDFRAGFESKNATVALATKIVLEQIRKMRDELVTDDELETAKASLIETFPRQFESRPQMLRVFVNDEWTGRPKDYWRTFRGRVREVTREDIRRVAQKHLVPEKMAILVVGDWEKIAVGDLEKRAAMNEFFGGRVKHLPLRDPLTLEPLAAEAAAAAPGGE